MSNAVFPSLPGLMWDVTRTPQFDTRVQTATSGKETRLAYRSVPIWRWVLKFDVLRQGTVAGTAYTELAQIVAFFNARQGKFDSFLYTDPTDSVIPTSAPQSFGVGDGSTTTFQLVRSFGGFTENVYDLNGAPSIYKAGVLQSSGYTVSSSGVVTFGSPPAVAAALTWAGTYYWRVRFDQDMAEFNNFLSQLWELKQLAFVSVL